MLYYTTLFLVILVVSVIAIWMYRAIIGFGRATYHSVTPGRRKVSARAKARLKARRKKHSKAQPTYIGRAKVPTPWGWKDTDHPHHAAQSVRKPGSDKVLWSGSSSSHAANGGTSSGSINSTDSTNTARKGVGWPYRKDKLAFAGKAYKVNRKAADNGDLNSEGKPWVW